LGPVEPKYGVAVQQERRRRRRRKIYKLWSAQVFLSRFISKRKNINLLRLKCCFVVVVGNFRSHLVSIRERGKFFFSFSKFNLAKFKRENKRKFSLKFTNGIYLFCGKINKNNWRFIFLIWTWNIIKFYGGFFPNKYRIASQFPYQMPPTSPPTTLLTKLLLSHSADDFKSLSIRQNTRLIRFLV
jgi:hypothetical protein